MTKRFLALAAVAVLASASVGHTQGAATSPYRGTLVQGVYSAVAADDTDRMIVIKYIGDQSLPATVTVVSAAATIAFTVNAIADTTINVQATTPCGAVVGTLDGTDGDCNTVGEMVDEINQSANWRAAPLDALRTDATTANIMAALVCNAKNPQGCSVPRDTNGATLWHFTRALTTCRHAGCIFPGLGFNTDRNPYKGTYTVLTNWTFRTTYGAGTSVYAIYSVVPSSTGAGETVTQLTTGTSGASNTFLNLGPANWGPVGLVGLPDAKLVVRVINDNSMSVTEGYAAGLLFRY